MVQIPGGSYLLGRTVEVPEWQSERQVRPPGPFWIRPNPSSPVEIASFCIDRFEYPNQKGERQNPVETRRFFLTHNGLGDTVSA